MSEIETKAALRRYVVEELLFGQEQGLTDDVSFLDQGIIDSTGVLALVAFLEKTFGIKVEDQELTPDNLDSVNAAARFVARKIGSG